jgi:hypothetical protein
MRTSVFACKDLANDLITLSDGERNQLERNELGALLVAAGLGPPAEHALISLLALNELQVSEAIGADIESLGIERGHRTLVVTRKGGKVVTSRAHRAPAARSTWPSASAPPGRSSWLRRDRAGNPGRSLSTDSAICHLQGGASRPILAGWLSAALLADQVPGREHPRTVGQDSVSAQPTALSRALRMAQLQCVAWLPGSFTGVHDVPGRGHPRPVPPAAGWDGNRFHECAGLLLRIGRSAARTSGHDREGDHPFAPA